MMNAERLTRPLHLFLAVPALALAAFLTVNFLSSWARGPAAGERGSVERVAVAQRVTESGFATPEEAALQRARQIHPHGELSAQRVILIYADQQQINLRVQVLAEDGLCQWFGVSGWAEDGGLEWSSPGNGEGISCS